MFSQAELISKGYHSWVPGLVEMFRDSVGPFILLASSRFAYLRLVNFCIICKSLSLPGKCASKNH